jgi:hypothetical protein
MGFSAEWLSLREPADIRARNPEVLAAFRAAAGARAREGRIALADLACGTGSTWRATAAALSPLGQDWRLHDYDPALLAEARRLALEAPAGVSITTIEVDLLADLDRALDGGADIVVTSAFLDLVSAAWLDRLVAGLAVRRLTFYAALTYDGRASLDPPHPLDAAVIAAVNRHQITDKGFGPALGPGAAAATVTALRAAGYRVVEGRSDWLFLPEEGLVQSMTVEGWAVAAEEIGGLEAEALVDWRHTHLTRIAEGATEIMVGHVDLFAEPGA